MQLSLLNRLRCPQCHGQLGLESFEQEGPESASLVTMSCGTVARIVEAVIIKEGTLLCASCKTWYPVHQYVPIMLVFSTQLHERFKNQHEGRLQALGDYSPPHGSPERGEHSTQETFTDEWDIVQEDQLSFHYSLDELRQLHRNVWLQHVLESPDKVKSILNVGIGLGQETVAVQDIAGGVEIIGVDINLAVLKSSPSYRIRPNFHIVVASLFHLPFASRSFDLVYSQGVLHHTYSTYEALKSIARYTQRNGYLVVWLYGYEKYPERGMMDRIVLRIKDGIGLVASPVVSRLPRPIRDGFFRFATIVCHHLIRSRVRHKAWNRHNSEHILRDWLSPRYAHQHDYNQVVEWFEDLGFKVIGLQSRAAYRRLFGKNLYGVGLTGRNIDTDLQ